MFGIGILSGDATSLVAGKGLERLGLREPEKIVEAIGENDIDIAAYRLSR